MTRPGLFPANGPVAIAVAVFAVALTMTVTSCAGQRGDNASPATSATDQTGTGAGRTSPQASPDGDKTTLTLDQITPVPRLPEPVRQKRPSITLDSMNDYLAARDHFTQGQYDKATTLAQKVVDNNPEWFEPRKLLARCLIGQEKHDEAAQQLQQALALQSDDLICQYLLGRHYLQAGNAELATRHMRLALQCTDADTGTAEVLMARFILARLLETQGYTRAAVQQFRAFLADSDPDNMNAWSTPEIETVTQTYRPDVFVTIGRLEALMGNYDVAIDAFNQALELRPNDKAATVALAAALSAHTKHTQALQTAEQALLQHPNDQETLRAYRAVLKAAGKQDAWPEELADLTRRHFDNDDLLKVTVRELIEHDHRDMAERLLQAAIQDNPDDLRTRWNLAELFLRNEQMNPAVTVMQDAVELAIRNLDTIDPRLTTLLQQSTFADDVYNHLMAAYDGTYPTSATALLAAVTRLAANKPEEALDPLGQAVALDDNLTAAWLAMANAYHQLCRHQDALDAATRAAESADNSAAVMTAIGRSHDDLDHISRAVDAYRQSITIRPTTTAMIQLATLYERTARLDQAIEQLQQAIILDPAHVQAHEQLLLLALKARNWDAARDAVSSVTQHLGPLPSVQALAAFYRFLTAGNLQQFTDSIDQVYQNTAVPPRVRFMRARANLMVGQTSQALADTEWVVADAEPASSLKYRALQFAAVTSRRLGRLDDAVAYTQQLLDCWPNHLDDRLTLLQLYNESLAFEAAADTAAHMIELYEDTGRLTSAYRNAIVLAMLADRRYDDAEVLLQRWLKNDDQQPRQRLLMQMSMMNVWEHTNRLDLLVDNALQWLGQMQNNDHRVLLRHELIRTLWLEGRPQQALDILETWSSQTPDDLALTSMTIELLLADNKFDQALQLARQAYTDSTATQPSTMPTATSSAPATSTAPAEPSQDEFARILLFVDTLMRTGHTSQAMEILDQTEQSYSFDAGNQLMLTRQRLQTLIAAHEYDQAEQLARSQMDRDGDNAIMFIHTLLEVYNKTDNLAATENLLNDVLEQNPDTAWAMNSLAYVWADRGINLDQAEAYLRTALRFEPRNAAYLDSLGWLLYKLQRYDSAHRYIDAAIRLLDEPDAVVYDHMGDILWRQGKHDQAADYWRRASKLIQLDRRFIVEPGLEERLDAKLNAVERNDKDGVRNALSKLAGPQASSHPATPEPTVP